MFDLYLYPFGIKNNEEYASVPGFLVSTAPKKAARNRMGDIFLIYYANHDAYKPSELQFVGEVLENTKTVFFKTSGPVTTASRTTAEFFNDQITQYNLKQSGRPTIIGSLHILVMRGEDIYILHAGDTSTYYLSRQSMELFKDNEVKGQRIGNSKSIHCKFYRVSGQQGDRLVFSANPPKTWNRNSISGQTRLSISHLRKLLINEADTDFESVLIQFRQGDGSVHILKLNPAPHQSILKQSVLPVQTQRTEDAAKERPPAVEEKHPVDDKSKVDLPEINQPVEYAVESQVESIPLEPDLETIIHRDRFEHIKSDTVQEKEATIKNEIAASKTAIDAVRNTSKITPPNEISDELEFEADQKGILLGGGRIDLKEKSQSRKSIKMPSVNPDQVVSGVIKIRSGMKKLSTWVDGLTQRIARGLQTLYVRSNPNEMDDVPKLSTTGMLFTVLIVPIVVVAIAMTVYLQGRSTVHDEKILEAKEIINAAAAAEERQISIEYYQSAIAKLDEAENYGTSDALYELRNFVQTQLDAYWDITRVNLKPSIAGGLDKRIQISKMVNGINGDVYALDESTGRVLRMMYSKPDYIVDSSFTCGPGKHGEVIVGELVDIESLPNQNAEEIQIMAIDGYGNLLLCSNKAPPAVVDLKDPDLGWSDIQAISYNGISLYILDVGSSTRDVISYESNHLAFSEAPKSIFAQSVPDYLQNIEDMTIYQDELYLLQKNQVLSRCVVGNSLVETVCDGSIGYGQIIEGQTRETKTIIEEALFSELLITRPPDPSMYFLDSGQNAIYHFSLAVNLQKQIRPNFANDLYSPEGQITAMSVSPTGVLHVAYGHDVFFGQLP